MSIALYLGRGVLAPRIGVGDVTVGDRTASVALIVEGIDGRTLKRAFPSTAHLYSSGVGPLDLVAADIPAWQIIDGNQTSRVDFVAVVNTIAPFVSTTGFLLGAADAVRIIGEALALYAAQQPR